MDYKRILIENFEKIHTTKMGEKRLKRNIQQFQWDIVEKCKNMIADEKSVVEKKGKNYYCTIDDIIITINSYSYTIITAHIS